MESAMEKESANRDYQATRLYSIPPVYDPYDERQKTGDYGLTHLAANMTKQPCLDLIIYYLLPSEAARLMQVRKIFSLAVEVAEEQIARHLHALYFSRVPLPVAAVAAIGGRGGKSTWTRYLHALINDRRKKILLMGGCHNDGDKMNMMIIDNDGTITWEECAPMIKKRWLHSAYYSQGQILLFSSRSGLGANGQGTNESYDVLSQISVELKHTLPIPDLSLVAMTELNGKVYVMGGIYDHNTATSGFSVSNSVFSFDMKQGQEGTWIEQDTRLSRHQYYGAAATYQGKLWLAGGGGDLYRSVEVFDPDVGSWQKKGNLTRGQDGSIALFVINDELFAAGETRNVMWIEKHDGQTGTWELVSELNDGNRNGCALAACGSTIYFLGGGSETWNSFDTCTKTWASQQEQYRDELTRQLPREFWRGQAVCITPTEQLLGLYSWTRLSIF